MYVHDIIMSVGDVLAADAHSRPTFIWKSMASSKAASVARVLQYLSANR